MQTSIDIWEGVYKQTVPIDFKMQKGPSELLNYKAHLLHQDEFHVNILGIFCRGLTCSKPAPLILCPANLHNAKHSAYSKNSEYN